MPLPRKSDAASSGGAPVLNIPNATVRLTDVEEYTEPFTVTRKSDGATFTLDPQFKGQVEVIDDGGDGTHNGEKFFEAFKYKRDKEGEWFNQRNSKLGALTQVVKPGYFDDASIPDLTEDDLEDFEMGCSLKPKRNPSTGAIVGTGIDWETMRPLPPKEKVASAAAEEDDDFSDTPF